MNQLQCRVDWDSLPWIAPLPGVRFKAIERGGRKLRLVEFLRGFQESDWCRKGHIGCVLEGEDELSFPVQTTPLKAGDGVFIPAGEEHKHILRVLSERVRVVLFEETIEP